MSHRWLTQQTDLNIATRVFSVVYSQMEHEGAWLRPERDEAIRGYVMAVRLENPAAATKWAGEISDPESRVQKTSYPCGKWYRQDPVAAEAWLDGAGFSEIHRNYIRGGAILGR